ncbi:MAG: ABC transporter transmembrane domain-containing protein, partial [Sciscionella sp.]
MTTLGAIAKQGGGWLPLIGVADLADTLATLALPLVLGKAIDALVSDGDTGRWMMISGALIALLVLSGLIDAFAGTVCTAGTTAWLRNRLVRHVLAIGPQAGRRFDTGDLVSRVSGNAAEAAQAGPGVVMVCTGVLPPIGSLALLAYLDLWLAVAFLAGLGLVALILRAFARRTAEVATAYQQIQGRLAARLSESLTGRRTIAAAGTVEQEEQRVLEPLPELHTEGRRIWQVLSRSTAQGTFTGPLVLVAVLATGGFELVAGRLSAGELFAAGQYAGIGAGLGALTGVVSRVARARAGVRRAAEVLTVEPVRYGAGTLPEGPGRLEFRAVTVRAEDATLLDNVELTVPGGAAVAVVGGSGAGKSVLAAVAARLHEPDEGTVLLDGVPLAGLDHRVLR